MLFNEVAQGLLRGGRMHQIAALLRGPAVVNDHVSHQHLAVQMGGELDRGQLRQMLGLGAVAATSDSVSSLNARPSSNMSTGGPPGWRAGVRPAPICDPYGGRHSLGV
jgi:hypothetical protein